MGVCVGYAGVCVGHAAVCVGHAGVCVGFAGVLDMWVFLWVQLIFRYSKLFVFIRCLGNMCRMFDSVWFIVGRHHTLYM